MSGLLPGANRIWSGVVGRPRRSYQPAAASRASRDPATEPELVPPAAPAGGPPPPPPRPGTGAVARPAGGPAEPLGDALEQRQPGLAEREVQDVLAIAKLLLDALVDRERGGGRDGALDAPGGRRGHRGARSPARPKRPGRTGSSGISAATPKSKSSVVFHAGFSRVPASCSAARASAGSDAIAIGCMRMLARRTSPSPSTHSSARACRRRTDRRRGSTRTATRLTS